MAMTCSKLSGVMKSVWTEDNLGWNKLMALEYDDALRNYRKDMQRQIFTGTVPSHIAAQVRFTGEEPAYGYRALDHVDMSPQAVRLRKQRVLEMNNRLAQVKRGNKPSYRQRQKNARAAKG